jgi:hypothetical protein
MGNRFTKMRDRSDDQLKATIADAFEICELALPREVDYQEFFWKICAGVDAYFEQRRRKDKVAAYGMVIETPVDPSSPAWGDETQ